MKVVNKNLLAKRISGSSTKFTIKIVYLYKKSKLGSNLYFVSVLYCTEEFCNVIA